MELNLPPISCSFEQSITKHKPYKESYVHFACNDTIHEIPNLYELSFEDIDAVWYSDAAFEGMRKSSSDIIKQMKNGIAPIGVFMRGLESYTKQGSIQQKRNISKACRSVLREQERQKSEEITDPEALAVVYRNSNVVTCGRAAYIRGLRDAMEVNEMSKKPSPFVPHIGKRVNPTFRASQNRKQLSWPQQQQQQQQRRIRSHGQA